MDYKYNAVNELNHFDFAEAVVGDIQLLGKMFHIVIDNVKILPENSFNRDIRTMRTNGMLFKIEGAEIISVWKKVLILMMQTAICRRRWRTAR